MCYDAQSASAAKRGPMNSFEPEPYSYEKAGRTGSDVSYALLGAAMGFPAELQLAGATREQAARTANVFRSLIQVRLPHALSANQPCDLPRMFLSIRVSIVSP